METRKTNNGRDHLKKRIVGMAIIFTLILGMGTLSFAYDVTVTNELDGNAQVELYVNFFGNFEHDSKVIGKNSSHTFKTGGWCPSGFKGKFVKHYTYIEKTIASTSILGHETGTSGFSAGCWNSSWKVCLKNEGTRDAHYGMCKQ
ncbi:MAG: hypothetical protein K4571_01760 [Deltaproteobacteria bacterium]